MAKLEGALGFLGYGNMGSAILEGLIEQGAIEPVQAAAFDPSEARQAAARSAGAVVVDSAEALAARSTILMLAVKPQQMREALEALRGKVAGETLVISIAAGVSIARIAEWLGHAGPIIRVMPNTPALVKAGAAGIAAGPGCPEASIAAARMIFEAIGTAEIVTERDLDAVTALSGSGPAYFFYFVECLERAAEAEGLDPAAARRLAAQTLLGAGRLLAQTGTTPGELREKVTSKGGTTEAALKAFQAGGFEALTARAVSAAAARSRELGG